MKQYYKAQECFKLDSICENQRRNSDSIDVFQKGAIYDQSMIIRNRDEVLSLKEYEISNLKLDNKLLNSSLRRQKMYKWIWMGIAATTAVYGGYRIIGH